VLKRFRRGVWGNRDFTRLWAAATISAFGTDITLTALPFVAILTLDATPWHLGLLKIATMLPAFVAGLFAGSWLDRVPRRPVMIACDWVRAALLLTIPLAVWLAEMTFAQLFLVAALLSVASTLFEIADRSMLPSIVRRDELVEANRMLTAGNTVSEASGFAVSGWLVQFISAPGALVVDAVTFVWSALTLRRIERVETMPEADEEMDHVLADALHGFKLVRDHAILAGLAGSLFVMSLSTQVIGTVYLLFVSEEIGFNPGVLGMIFAVGGLFSLLASISAGRIMNWIGVGPLLIAAPLFVAGGQSLIALVSAVTVVAVILMVIQQATDMPWSLYEITQVSLRQSVTNDEWLGRMNGCFHVLELGGYLLGAIAGAWLGQQLGLRGTILIGAVGTALAALPPLFSPVRTLKHMPAAELRPAVE
jgi:MFS family permease